jgi:hypothetical protein
MAETQQDNRGIAFRAGRRSVRANRIGTGMSAEPADRYRFAAFAAISTSSVHLQS